MNIEKQLDELIRKGDRNTTDTIKGLYSAIEGLKETIKVELANNKVELDIERIPEDLSAEIKNLSNAIKNLPDKVEAPDLTQIINLLSLMVKTIKEIKQPEFPKIEFPEIPQVDLSTIESSLLDIKENTKKELVKPKESFIPDYDEIELVHTQGKIDELLSNVIYKKGGFIVAEIVLEYYNDNLVKVKKL